MESIDLEKHFLEAHSFSFLNNPNLDESRGVISPAARASKNISQESASFHAQQQETSFD